MGGKRKLRVWLKIEWERMLNSRLVYISLLIGFVIAIMQIIGEVYPRAVNPLKYYSGKVGEPFSLYMFSMSMNTGSLYKEIFITIFPVLAMLPHALSYHMDVKSGYVKNVYIKTKKINYLIAKYIVTFVSGFACSPQRYKKLAYRHVSESVKSAKGRHCSPCSPCFRCRGRRGRSRR